MLQIGQMVEGYVVLRALGEERRSLLFEVGRGEERAQLKLLLPTASEQEQESFLEHARQRMEGAVSEAESSVLRCGRLADGSPYLIQASIPQHSALVLPPTLSPTASSDLPTHFGQYEAVRLLAEGGMGQVFEVLDRQGQRRAAIKLMRPEIAQRPGFTERFMDEVRAPNIINDPGVITVLHRDQLPDGRPYIVMEFVEGKTLSAYLKQGLLSAEEVARFGWLLATTLAKAHDKGVIHRDLKPDKITPVEKAL